MKRTGLSLKWLEVFEAVARTGSVRATALRLGISVSTVSHHIACLETEVGRPLLDHGKRPMRLTPAGAILLRRVEESLGSLRLAMSEVWSDDPGVLAGELRIAAIEDFDRQVIAALAGPLGAIFPVAEMSFLSRPSHEVISLLQSEDAEIGIASTAETPPLGLVDNPLLRDPYLVVLPVGRDESARACLDGQIELPFLRYSMTQLIGRRVEAQLRRLKLDIPRRFTFETTPPILTLVARGEAWTITTALTLATAPDLSGRFRALALPDAGFARQISLLRREDLSPRLFETVAAALRPQVQKLVIDPMIAREPSLEGSFRLLDGHASSGG